MNLLLSIDKYDSTITKRLRLKGITDEFQAYRIPLENLVYNVGNDRIATFISQHIDEKGIMPTDKESINRLLEEYIVASNPDAFNKTKSNIKAIGQTEVAVVMSDGIVIDGNRRFTALRQLSREGAGSEFSYIEAVILDKSKYEAKDIKRLELNLQHAVESKVDYNPVERLVGVYRDLVKENHPFEIEEYARETQLKVSKVKEEVELAILLVDYLKYINQPLKFHIARTQKIDGPIREIYKILKSKKIDDEDKDDVKDFLFANILALDGDITRKIRDLKPVLDNTKSRESILEEVEDSLDDLNDYFEDEEIESAVKESGIINLDSSIRKSVVDITEKYVELNKLSKAKHQPIETLRKALEHIQGVDTESAERLSGNTKNEFMAYLEKISSELNKLEEITNVN